MGKDIIFFIGIGGISMSGLALWLKSRGYNVVGSDIQSSETTRELVSAGINVYIGHKEENIVGANVVVFNSAISLDNPELVYAQKNNLSIWTRGELLGLIANEHKEVIAVAGTHGKTTTTAMIGEIFEYAGLNPTIHIGGISKNLCQHFIVGGTDYFITEACEYKDNFLSLSPSVGALLNIDKDHMDYFKNKRNLTKSFKKFCKKCKKCVIFDDFLKNNLKIINLSSICHAENICEEKGKYSFDCMNGEEKMGRVCLKVYHQHNIDNALFAISVALLYGIDKNKIIEAINMFDGVKRRFEHIGMINGADVIIDYAHHPKEIQNAISSAKNMSDGKTHVVFQPHTYSRTRKLFNEFVDAFEFADRLYIFKTYPAREKFDLYGDARFLSKKIKEQRDCEYHDDYNKLKEKISSSVEKGDVILVLGAGNINEFANFLI